MRFKLLAGSMAFLILVWTMASFPGMQADTAVTATGNPLTVVGLYSETGAGNVSYRVGTANWVIVKVGDQIPENAEIRINVDRDWVEVIPSNNSNLVYELNGSGGVPLNKKVADLLKEKPRTVNFPKADSKADPKFANKVVVKQYLGRQVYQPAKGEEWTDIKYGHVLKSTGNVNIIGINNTLILVTPDGKETKVIGPLKFSIKDLLAGKNLYKYMNVTK